jgi:hypothetical protein
MHSPSPDAEPGPHESERVVPPAPVPPEMQPIAPEIEPKEPMHQPQDVPGEGDA